MNIITREQDGTYVAHQTFLVTCGCGSVTPDARSMLRMSGCGDVPLLTSSGNPTVKAYIHQIKLDEKVRSLKKSKHAVLYNPGTGKYINLLEAPLNAETYENIRKVVHNG